MCCYISPDENAIYDTRSKISYKDMIKRKRKLFEAADLDGDKKLTKDELADFIHPGLSHYHHHHYHTFHN